MTATPGSAGTAGRDYKIDPPAGRHRAPPPVPAPRTPAVIAVAAAVLTAASLVAIAGAAVAPDAGGVHGSRVSTTARASATVLTGGPLAIPTVGASGAWEPPSTTTAVPRNPLRRPVPSRSVRTSTRTFPTPEALRNDSVAILAPSSAMDLTPTPTVTPPPQAVTTTTAAAPPTVAAASSSATPTSEETTVTPTTSASVTVGVTAGVTP